MRPRGAPLLLAAALGCGAPSAPPAPPPNVLLITLDTTRRDHLSVYGYERDTTPGLVRFAAEGARFERAYAPASITAESHATLFTGLYPIEHGVVKNGLVLAERHATMAERLRALGMQTAAIVSSFVLDRRFGWRQGFDHYEDDFQPAEASWKIDHWYEFPMSTGTFDRRANFTTERALRWLARDRDPARPFFLFVHYFDPHDPYDPPPPFDVRFKPKPGEAQSLADALRSREWIDAYDGEIAFTDAQISRLLAGLAELGLAERTLVVVVADHGEGLMQHEQMGHGANIHEEVVRVPLLVRWPGVVAAGAEIDAPIEQIDVLPTVLDLVGASRDDRLYGRSLAPALRSGQRLDPAHPVYLHRRPFENQFFKGIVVDGEQFGVVRDGWKWIEGSRDGTRALYDLASDPLETVNRAATEPDRVRELSGLVRDWRAAHTAPNMATPPIAPEDARKLKALGYAE